jgi:hypothetical protein
MGALTREDFRETMEQGAARSSRRIVGFLEDRLDADAGREYLERYMSGVWESGNPGAVSEFLAPAYRRHLAPLLPSIDKQTQVERLKGFKAAFPDISITIQDVVVEGERIAFRGLMRGTHQGEAFGLRATGRKVEVRLLDIMRVEGGLIAEQWGGPDVYDLLRQLGAKVVPGD